MRLSLSKLERFLASREFIAKSFFTIDDNCTFVEVVNINTTDTLFIYINEAYNLDVSKKQDVFKLKMIDINNEEFEDDIKDKYSREPDNMDIEKDYEEIDISESKRENIEEFLEDNYKKELLIRDINKDDTVRLKEINRQLKRMKFCVQTIKYKLSILYKNYLCIINIENEIDLYQIKSYEGENLRNLYVIIDLESLYNNISTVNSDIVNIRQGLYNIFDKNQRKHISNFERMITEGQSIFGYIEKLNQKKIQYEEYLQKLYSMIDNINQSEKEKLEKIENLREEYDSKGGIHTDIQKSHIISKYEAEIDEIKNTKHKVVKNIFNIRNKLDDMVLYSDKIFFDNLVMIDSIIKNINSLNII
jgi:hypothetical protein